MSMLETVDFAMLFKVLAVGFLLFWLAVIGWVVFDSRERFHKVIPRVLTVLLVVFLPLFGLLIYLIIRPKSTMEEDRLLELEQRYLKFEAAGLGDCPECGHELLPNFIFCPECGKELRTKCVSCEVYLEPDWQKCPFCGAYQKNKRIEGKIEASRKNVEEFAEEMAEVPEVPLEPEGVDQESETIAQPVTGIAVNEPGSLAEIPSEPTSLPEADTSERKEKQPTRRGGKVKDGLRRLVVGADGFVQMVGKLPSRVFRKRVSRAELEKKFSTDQSPVAADQPKKRKKRRKRKHRRKTTK